MPIDFWELEFVPLAKSERGGLLGEVPVLTVVLLMVVVLLIFCVYLRSNSMKIG